MIALGGESPYGGENWQRLKSLVLNSLFSVHSKRAYDAALDEFLLWFQCQPDRVFTKAFVQRYVAELQAKELAPASIKSVLLRSAVWRLKPPTVNCSILQSPLLFSEFAAHADRVFVWGIGLRRNRQGR